MTKKQLLERDSLPKVFIDDMLMSVKYFTDEAEPHLKIISQDICKCCSDRPCLYFCPVGAYRQQEDGSTTIAFQSCVECGSCRVACPPKNVLWKYPRGGFGVSYKFG